MHDLKPTVMTVLFGLMLAASAPVWAQDRGTPDGRLPGPVAPPRALASPPRSPNAFGGNTQRLIIYVASWMPVAGSPPFGRGDLGYLYAEKDTYSNFMVQIPLAAGSTVEAIVGLLSDLDDGADWALTFTGTESGSDLFPPGRQSYASAFTSGQPGLTWLTLSFSPVLIRAVADINGDGHPTRAAYFLALSTVGSWPGYQTLGFWGVEVQWHRTISPAPATATFPDVPTNFWAFQYVEALAASGITQGMPDGNFHPKDPVTRAQMATFLARALGLHWPE